MLTLKISIAVVAMAAAYGAVVLDRDTQVAWGNHVKKYRLQFNSAAIEAEAKTNFAAADKLIQAHNSDPTQSYKQGHSKFSHMSAVQKNALKSVKFPKTDDGIPYYNPPRATKLPASVDYRTHKCMQPIKYQGLCGNCYAFSAVSVIEFAHCIKHGTPVSLSEQQVIDCAYKYQKGCIGGRTEKVWKYVADNGGIDTDAFYPSSSGSTNISESCSYDEDFVGAQLASTSAPYTKLTPFSVSAIQQVLANKGLVAVYINANENWSNFRPTQH